MTSSTEAPARPVLLDALGKLDAAERLLTTALASTEAADRADISDALDLCHKALGLVSDVTSWDLHPASPKGEEG